MASIFEPGRNCYRSVTADRVALLIDGDDYFRAFVQAATLARHSIIILAWDFDSRMRLHCNESSNMPSTLGPFLNYLVRRRSTLQIYILDWDYPMLFGTDREFPPLYGLGWSPHRRVHLRYDNTHPVAASHHQKVVVIDDALAFSGGLDLTIRRWDTSEHRADNPRRVANGERYPPFHDLMAAVDGEAAQVLAGVSRERWKIATGKTIPASAHDGDVWPAELKVDISGVTVGISRTTPKSEKTPEVREVEQLYLDMIVRARRYIYIENQYFTAKKLGDAIAARLGERDGPEIAIVLRCLSHGWLEENTMHALRTGLMKQLRAADRWQHLSFYYPEVPGLKPGTCVDVHSKAMVVDDEWLRIGSANLCNRSMGTDTECDLTFESQGKPPITAAIRDFRDRLLAEHLGVEPTQVCAEYRRASTIRGTIAALQRQGRTLKKFGELPEWPGVVVELAATADPERPASLDKLIKEFSPDIGHGNPSWLWIAVVIAAAASLAAAWKFTPLAQLADPDLIVQFAHDFGRWPWAPLVVLLAYTPACVIMFPRPLITLFAVAAFGAGLGFVYALTGVLLAALAAYVVGRMAGRDTVRRLAGPKLNRVSDILRRRGLLAITALRLVPVAPFVVGSMVAGAIRIGMGQYLLGTALGMLPGTLATTIFGDQLESALRNPSQINYWLVTAAAAILVAAVFAVRRWMFGTHPAPSPVRKRTTAS